MKYTAASHDNPRNSCAATEIRSPSVDHSWQECSSTVVNADCGALPINNLRRKPNLDHGWWQYVYGSTPQPKTALTPTKGSIRMPSSSKIPFPATKHLTPRKGCLAGRNKASKTLESLTAAAASSSSHVTDDSSILDTSQTLLSSPPLSHTRMHRRTVQFGMANAVEFERDAPPRGSLTPLPMEQIRQCYRNEEPEIDQETRQNEAILQAWNVQFGIQRRSKSSTSNGRRRPATRAMKHHSSSSSSSQSSFHSKRHKAQRRQSGIFQKENFMDPEQPQSSQSPPPVQSQKTLQPSSRSARAENDDNDDEEDEHLCSNPITLFMDPTTRTDESHRPSDLNNTSTSTNDHFDNNGGHDPPPARATTTGASASGTVSMQEISALWSMDLLPPAQDNLPTSWRTASTSFLLEQLADCIASDPNLLQHATATTQTQLECILEQLPEDSWRHLQLLPPKFNSDFPINDPFDCPYHDTTTFTTERIDMEWSLLIRQKLQYHLDQLHQQTETFRWNYTKLLRRLLRHANRQQFQKRIYCEEQQFDNLQNQFQSVTEKHRNLIEIYDRSHSHAKREQQQRNDNVPQATSMLLYAVMGRILPPVEYIRMDQSGQLMTIQIRKGDSSTEFLVVNVHVSDGVVSIPQYERLMETECDSRTTDRNSEWIMDTFRKRWNPSETMTIPEQLTLLIHHWICTLS